MRTHTIPLYCLAIGQCVGVLLEKIFQYDVSDMEYKFKVRFAPITRVKKSDFGQPISYGGQTFFFGHDIKNLYEMASIVRHEHDVMIKSQLDHFGFLARRLKNEWETVTAAVNQELVSAGQSAVGIATAEQAATAHDNPNARGAQLTEAPTGGDGQVERRIAAYNIYITATRPPGAEKDCGSAAYCAIIHNISTGECTELVLGVGARSLSRLDVLALCAVFESGIIPHSLKACQTIATVYSKNEFIVNMFAKDFLKGLADNGWKTREGKDAKNKDEWQRVIAHTSHMTVKGAVPGEGDAVMGRCVMLAQKAATDEYNSKFGPLPPPNYKGGEQ